MTCQKNYLNCVLYKEHVYGEGQDRSVIQIFYDIVKSRLAIYFFSYFEFDINSGEQQIHGLKYTLK